jgi:hypothetical protein
MTQAKKKTKTKKKFDKKVTGGGGAGGEVAAAAAVIKEEKKDIDEHPLQIGHCLIVKYRDGSDRLVRVGRLIA